MSRLTLPQPYSKDKMPPHQSASADSFPSRGSLWSRQKAVLSQKSLPLEGKVARRSAVTDEVERESRCKLK